MPISFSESKTKKNLLRAFAGESQARNRYTFAASCAKKNNLYVIEAVFKFTAEQELAHAKVFFDYLKEFSGETITIDGTYPVEDYVNVLTLLKNGHHNEYEEYEDVYKNFGDIALEEGFNQIGTTFHNIAKIEKTHGDRFNAFAKLLEENKLFVSDIETKWMCLNCGHIYEGTIVPDKCPVCSHDKGYFVRLELASFSKN